jgi:hypothetical protein
MSKFEVISHKPYIQRNYIPAASAKQVLKIRASIPLICTSPSQNA